jgi:heat-inducible transcriptional repressor
MEELTHRQIEILKALIKEYTLTGVAVGSEIIEKKYRLGVSPATIRNEMVVLVEKGYLDKGYFSSGREPTTKAMRYYINNIMKQKEMSTMDEVSMKNSVWDDRANMQRLLSGVTKEIAAKTGLMGFSYTNENDLYYWGAYNLFSMNEFIDLKIAQGVLEKMEDIGFLKKLLDAMFKSKQPVAYFIGEEDFGDPRFTYCGGVIGTFENDNVKGILGLFGPRRMNFDTVIPQVRYANELINSLI